MPLNAAVYLPPTDAIFLKLDQVPLDVETMHSLASSLVKIATTNPERSAKKLQASAKLIAIASQLNPQNPSLEKVNLALQSGAAISHDPASAKPLGDATLALTLRYLNSAENLPEAQNLAQRIGNSLKTLYPNNPHYSSLKTTQRDWTGIVASLSEFSKNPDHVLMNNERVSHSTDTIEEESGELTAFDDGFIQELDQEENISNYASWNKTKFTVSFPSTLKSSTSTRASTLYRVLPLQVIVTPQTENAPNKLSFDSNSFRLHSSERTKLQRKISTNLKAVWDDGFTSAELRVKHNKSFSKDTDFDVLSAALSIGLDASLLDRDLAPNLVIALGQKSTETFSRGKRFWEYLPLLRKMEPGKRILVSPDAEGDLRQLLVTSDGTFFIDQEIISVSDLSSSRSVRVKNVEGDFAKASDFFKEIQQVMQDKSIRSMATNSHVRSKLKEILTLNPNHLSAKMLLLLGGDSKPNRIESKYIGYEINAIICEVNGVLSMSYNNTSFANNLVSTGEEIEDRIREFSSHVNSNDREHLELLEDLADKLRSAGKSKLKSLDYYSNSSSYHSRSYNDDIRDIGKLKNSLLIEATKLIKAN
jgi:hypothetical protein